MAFKGKEPVKRQRLNFGYERFACNGSLLVHLNDSYISVMVKHDLEHPTVNRKLDPELIQMIENMSLTSTPSQIFRELKAKERTERLISLTIKQVFFKI